MIPSVPPLNGVRTFVAAARAGSFLKAADELCVTPAAVSRSIRALEEHLGCALFLRNHRQISLTEDGQFYLRELGDAFERIAVATQNLAARRRTRPLAVCAYPTFIIDWLIPRWSRQQLRDSNFDLRFITTHTHEVDFSNESIDIAILTDRAVYGNNVCEKLFTASLVPVCNPNYLPPGTTADDIEEWRDGVLISETRSHDWERWAAANGHPEFEGREGRRFESSQLMYQAAIAGLGIGIGIREILFREFAAGSLVNPFPDSVPVDCPFYMIWPASTEAHPYFTPFRNWIRREVGAD